MNDTKKTDTALLAEKIDHLTHVLSRVFAKVDCYPMGEQINTNVIDSLNKIASSLSDIAKAIDKNKGG